MWALAFVWSAALVAAFVAFDPLFLNHDNALFLEYAAMLLDGAVPYVGFMDLNPPLVVYLNTIPVAIARVAGASPIPVFTLTVAALAAASAAWTFRLLGRRGAAIGPSERLAVVFATCAVSVLLVATGEFGQREHVWILCYVPFLALRWGRWTGGEANVGRAEAAAAGVLAALGLYIKPWFVLAALAPEALWLARTRRWRALAAPEVAGAAAVGVAYALHFLAWTPEMREGFFARAIPLYVERYAAYNCSTEYLVGNYYVGPIAGAAAVAAGAAWLARPRLVARSLVETFAVFTAAGLAIYLLQLKGYLYHLVPVAFGIGWLAALAICGLASWLADEAREGNRAPWARAVLPPVAAMLVLLFLSREIALLYEESRADGRAGSHDTAASRAIERYSKPGDAVLSISTIPRPGYPAVMQTGRRPASRYIWAYPIALVYYDPENPSARVPYRAPGALDPEEQRYLDEMKADIARTAPAVIFVDNSPSAPACPPGFNVLAYLRHTGFLSDAMANYAPVGTVDAAVVFVRR
jgi:hypothetical protein